MQILGTGTRDVQILAPLTVAQTATFNGNITVAGSITCNSTKPWIGLFVNGSGSIISNVGQVPTSAITVSIASNVATMTFTNNPHPLGLNGYLTFAQAISSTTFSAATTTNTATTINVYIRNAAGAILGGSFYIYSVP